LHVRRDLGFKAFARFVVVERVVDRVHADLRAERRLEARFADVKVTLYVRVDARDEAAIGLLDLVTVDGILGEEGEVREQVEAVALHVGHR
jgi:hypothetical protein